MDHPEPRHFVTRLASWERDRKALRSVRFRVFVEEQKVPPELEWDTEDAGALHLLAEDIRCHPVGTARLLPSGQIGRMAVLSDWRGRGVGGHLLRDALRLAQARSFPRPWVHAQVHAEGFYRVHGFEPGGEIFSEAGIPHRRMDFAKEFRS